MVEVVVYTRANRTDVRRALSSLPQRMCGGGAIASETLANCGVALLDHIQEAFAVKSRGGTDEAGEKWPSLSPKTIARRLAKQNKATTTNQYRPTHALTEQQRDRWWSVYRRQLVRFRGNKSSAARVAWTVVKMEGGQTIVDKYGHQQVDILRDTNDLMNSLTPGSGSALAVFNVTPAQVEVGTTRPYAKAHHRGVPSRRLPQRRLWPSPDKWPSTWWQGILSEVQVGIVEMTIQIVDEVGRR